VFAIVFVVIMVIPVAIVVPAMIVFIPPAMIVAVAILAGFVQVVASGIGLAAFASMMLDGFMKTMIGAADALLAVVIGAQTRGPGEEQKSRQRGAGYRDFCGSKNS
jgi:hypothetical protein